MKKIFTLLLCTVIISCAFAQNEQLSRNDNYAYNNSYNNNTQWHHNDRDYNQRDNDRSGYQDHNSTAAYQEQQAIQAINEQFDCKIQEIINDCSLNHFEKKIAIENLQSQKAKQIYNISCRYSSNNANTYNNQHSYYQRNDDNCNNR